MTAPPPEDPEEREPSSGRMRPTSPGAITAWAAVGLVGGWSVRPVSVRVQGTAPIVTWAQPLAVLLVAAILGAVGWATWRSIQVRREYLEPQRAVNRLVLARACALVGALVAGGYAGYAVAWIGIDTDLGSQRAWRSAAAALAGIAVVVTALLLEQACRVPPDDVDDEGGPPL